MLDRKFLTLFCKQFDIRGVAVNYVLQIMSLGRKSDILHVLRG